MTKINYTLPLVFNLKCYCAYTELNHLYQRRIRKRGLRGANLSVGLCSRQYLMMIACKEIINLRAATRYNQGAQEG
jgi:hypothetical protein